MWSLRWHFTNKSVTGAPYSIKSYSLSRSWTLWCRVRWLKVAAELQQRWRRTNRRRKSIPCSIRAAVTGKARSPGVLSLRCRTPHCLSFAHRTELAILSLCRSCYNIIRQLSILRLHIIMPTQTNSAIALWFVNSCKTSSIVIIFAAFV